MIVTILVYSLLGWNENIWLRFGTRILLLPVIAGLAYELLKFAAKGDSLFFRIIRWPGMQLQRLTTAQPTDEQMEVAILAFEMALGEKSEQEIEEMRERFDHSAKEAAEESELPEETAEEFPAATAAK